MSLAWRSTSPSASMVEPTVRSFSSTLIFMFPPERMAEPVLVTLSDSLSFVSMRNRSKVLLLLALASALACASAPASAEAPADADWSCLDAPALACA